MALIYVKLIMMAVFWGGTFIAGRDVAQHIGPFSAAFLRFSIAGAGLLLISFAGPGRIQLPGRRHLPSLILLGLTGVFAYNVFFFKGLKLIAAGRAGVIIATNPVFIALFAALIFGDRLNSLKLAGIGLSVCGAVVVITRGQPGAILSEGIGLGELFILCCVVSWVTFSLLGKAVMKELTPRQSITYSAIVGAFCLLPPAIWEGLIRQWPYPLNVWVDVFYLGVFGTVLGFVWFYQGIQAIGPAKAGLFINFVPVSAVLLAHFILDEPLTWSLLAGVVLVSAGVYLTNRG